MTTEEEREKRALLRTYCVWSWLAKNPNRTKKDYPLYQELKIYREKEDCSLCTLFNDLDCEGCVLTNIGQQCVFGSSWFGVWVENHVSLVKRAQSAGNIARAVWNRYKELGG